MDNVAIILVNNVQVRLIQVLEKLHIIKVIACDDLKRTLSDRLVCKMAYISSAKWIMSLLHDSFNSGFLVSKNGQDRRNFEEIVTFINEGLEALDEEM